MSIILIRHPETDWNVKGLFQGRQEGRVTEAGAQAARDFVAALNLPSVHHIYHAPNQRTRYLADLLKARYAEAEVSDDERLHERSYGVYEGQSTQEVATAHNFDPANVLARFTWSPHHGESYQDVSDRTNEFIWELQAAHAPQEVVICISSAAAIRSIMHVQHGLSLADLFELQIPNLHVVYV